MDELIYVWNPTEENISTKIFGSWFSFPAGSKKSFHKPGMASFIEQNRKETGLVVLPAEFNPNSEKYIEHFEKTEDGKRILAERRETGINNLIEFHLAVVRNNQVALANDISRQYGSPETGRQMAKYEASKGELESMRLVAKYKGKSAGNAQKKADEIEKLMKEIGPIPA
jgi:hypothetical protein